MSTDRLNQIRERWAAATPGPWASHYAGVYEGCVTDCQGPTVICQDPEMDDRPADRLAIAAAPEDVAWLVASLVGCQDLRETAERERDEARAERDKARAERNERVMSAGLVIEAFEAERDALLSQITEERSRVAAAERERDEARAERNVLLEREKARRSLTAGDILTALDQLGAPPSTAPVDFPAYEHVHLRVEALAAERDEARAEVERLREQLALAAPTTDAQGRTSGIARLLARVGDLRAKLHAVEDKRDAALARVAALEAVLAEPDVHELHRLERLASDAWSMFKPIRPMARTVRAILADLRQRAGVADV